jgi:hypothetical protein
MCNCIPSCKDRQQHIVRLKERLRIATDLPKELRDSEYIFGLKFVIRDEMKILNETVK